MRSSETSIISGQQVGAARLEMRLLEQTVVEALAINWDGRERASQIIHPATWIEVTAMSSPRLEQAS